MGQSGADRRCQPSTFRYLIFPSLKFISFLHHLLGAFGSGAAFALEDAWIFAQSLMHTRSLNRPVAEALRIFDSIRSPYYLRMYQHLDQQKKIIQDAKASNADQSFGESLGTKVGTFGGEKLTWIYGNDIQGVWKEYLSTVNGA
jgi:salicylate hydroxylase